MKKNSNYLTLGLSLATIPLLTIPTKVQVEEQSTLDQVALEVTQAGLEVIELPPIQVTKPETAASQIQEQATHLKNLMSIKTN